MVDYEINETAAAVDKAVRRLFAAKVAQSNFQIERAEEEICMETRTLFARFVDVALWSNEVDHSTYLCTRKAIKLGTNAVEGRRTDVAQSIRRRSEEFATFVQEHARKERHYFPLLPLNLKK